MAPARWSDKLKTGDCRVDDQHESLIALVNELHDAIREKREPSAIDELLNQVITFAEQHFRDEEELMRRYEYPGLAEQQAMHAELTKDVDRLVEEYRASGDTIPLKFAAFLYNWFVSHMKLEDRKIVWHIDEVTSAENDGSPTAS